MMFEWELDTCHLLSRQICNPLHHWCYTIPVQDFEYGRGVYYEQDPLYLSTKQAQHDISRARNEKAISIYKINAFIYLKKCGLIDGAAFLRRFLLCFI